MAARTALQKVNLIWVLQLAAQGFKQSSALGRFASAVYHLCRTPLGSYYADPAYGTTFHLMRTQGKTEALLNAAEAQLVFGVNRYIPDIVVTDVVMLQNPNEDDLQIKVVWVIQGADPKMHGDLGRPQQTTVSY